MLIGTRRTCEEVGHVGVEVLDNIHGALQEEYSVIVPIEQPFEAFVQSPVGSITGGVLPTPCSNICKHQAEGKGSNSGDQLVPLQQ